MLISMTGYGKASCQVGNQRYNVEIKSLNSKQTDILLKLPQLLKEKELQIRNEIANRLSRGKIDVYFEIEKHEEDLGSVINPTIVKNYYTQLKKITSELNINNDDQLLSIIMRLPEILSKEKLELKEEDWKTISEAINSAIDSLIDYRIQEGKALQEDIIARINEIIDLIKAIEIFEPNRLTTIRNKINKSLNDTLSFESIDKDRFEQEMIYYFEKLDINEEKVRLKKHCDTFLLSIKEEEPVGKKLGFIAQEITREINTIGSKANDYDIQNTVIKMKDEIEKVKEQLMNVL